MSLDHALLALGNDTVTDVVRVNAPGSLHSITLYCSTAYTTAGTTTVDVELNGVSILSAPVDLTAVPALPSASLVATMTSSPVLLVAGDALSFIATSDNVDLAGAGLRLTTPTSGN